MEDTKTSSSAFIDKKPRKGGVTSSRVINQDYLVTLGDIYKCNICFDIMINSTDCEKCGHSYCFDCISNFPCPFNCSDAKVRPSSIGIKILLNTLQFRCENSNCNERIPYSSLITHDQECEFQNIKCPSYNCGRVLAKRDLEVHIKEECQFVTLKCPNCSYDFYRVDFETHKESCDQIYSTLNSESGARESIHGKQLNTKQYLEALSLNIGKIIRENAQKFKSIEEENVKVKHEINSNIEKIIETFINKMNKGIESNQENCNRPIQMNLNVEDLLCRFKDEYAHLVTTNVDEILSKSLMSISTCIKKVEEDIENVKTNQSKINEENLKLIKPLLQVNENNIHLYLTELKELILNEFNLVKKEINSNEGKKLETIVATVTEKLSSITEHLGNNNGNSNLMQLPQNFIEIITDNIDKVRREVNKQLESFTLNQDALKEEVTSSMAQLHREIAKEKESPVINSEQCDNKSDQVILNEVQYLKEDLDSLKIDIKGINKNTKDIKLIISEEFAEILQSIKEDNNKPQKDSVGHQCGLDISERSTLSLKNLTIDPSILSSVENSIKERIDFKIEELEKKIQDNFDKKQKEMYNLKWCYECEKVDYFFGFIKCDICINETCKQCVILCKKCKKLYCTKCTKCPSCTESNCLNCRDPCNFCSKEDKQKFCSSCLIGCFFCRKVACKTCIKQCMSCSNPTCQECARNCKICDKNSCRRCETSKNFKTCYLCLQTACKECVILCDFCDLEICKYCFNECKMCKKLICKKCATECGSCFDNFCTGCTKDFQHNKCNLCKKQFCLGCVKNLRKCKKCSQVACKQCCAVCKKCRNLYCNDCNTQCDNCDGRICSSCVYRCVCDVIIFCEKCLTDVIPIGPHDCVQWINDTTVFTGTKSRSKLKLPPNFEVKLFLEKYSDLCNLLVGVTDNDRFSEDTVSFVDNIWTFKAKTGQKYSSKNSAENYYDKECREGDSIMIAVKNDNLYFRVNLDDNPPAFALPSTKTNTYWLYIENDSPLSSIRVKFVYIRKI